MDKIEADKLLKLLIEAKQVKDDLAVEILYTRLVNAGYRVVEEECLN